MKWEKLRAHALGPYRGEVELDFSTIPGPLIAVTGPNGAGKSTLLGLLAGALYRELRPTRLATKPLAEIATARDAYVEVVVVNGSRYTVRQSVDCISGKGESVVLLDGASVLPTTSVREYDLWAKKHLISDDVLYSSSFAVQGEAGFVELTAGERKGVFLRALRISWYEQLAESARKNASAVSTELEGRRAALAELPEPDFDALHAGKRIADSAVAETTERLRDARTALVRAQAASVDQARAAELAEQRRAVQARLQLAQGALTDLQTRIANNLRVLERAAEIRTALQKSTQHEQELAAARERVLTLTAALDACKTAERTAELAGEAAVTATTASNTRAVRAESRLADRVAVKQASEKLPKLKDQEGELKTTIAECEQDIAAQQSLMLNGKDERIGHLRHGLSTIADEASAIAQGIVYPAYAAVVLHNDDNRAGECERAPDELKSTRAKLTTHKNALEQLQDEIAKVERLAARKHEIETAELDYATALADRKAAQLKIKETAAALVTARAVTLAAEADVQLARAAAAPIEQAIASLADTVKLHGPLQQAQARLEELHLLLPPAQAALALVQGELAALPALPEDSTSVELSAYETDVTLREQQEHAARDQQTRAAQACEAAQARVARRAELLAAITIAQRELSDWTRLQQDLGRDGLQAMEIDAAIPEVNAMANALLHDCHGPRFTVELTTQRLNSTGKRSLEELDVRVIDTVKGLDQLAEKYSGGELVIVNEAVCLALTMLSCRSAGIETPTLVRDESGAALDPENGRAYVAMLRLAARQMNADRVLYVSHTPELQALADGHITIGEDGTVTT